MQWPFRTGAQPLSLFTPVSGGGINIASWHSRHSLTWSWILSARRHPSDGSQWRLWFSTWKNNDGRQWWLGLPFVGIQWHRQKPMWFRDVMRSQSDRHREDEREAFDRGRRTGRRDVFQGVG